MCEAYSNHQLTEAQVMTLLGRSQDLTAVILAVEQLTGTVSARQSTLTTGADADAFAVATGVAKLLEFAEKRKQATQDRLNAAQLVVNQRTTERDREKTARDAAEAAADAQKTL